ncbi:MAG: hypothetical protein Q9170_008395, partial [Blastenia crenularia]
MSKSNNIAQLISLTPLTNPDSTSTLSTAQSLLSALTNSGFLYLTDSPIPSSLLSRVFALSARFFDRPREEKDALGWTTARANRGYTSMGREKVSLQMSKEAVAEHRSGEGEDQKESFEIGRDDEDGQPNQWPEGDAEFKDTMMEFFERCKELHK